MGAASSSSRSTEKVLTNRLFFEDRRALPDQMYFFLTFPWRGFVLAVRDRDRANKNEIASFVFSVTAKDFSHGVLRAIERSAKN
jgi:hypothetical protein